MTTEQIVSQKTKDNPLWYHQKVLNRNLWSKEIEIIEALQKNREVAVRSCNASGKTYTAAGIVHQWLCAYAPNSTVITTAPTGRQVKEVLWREIKQAIPRGYYASDSITETKINLGPKCFAIGLATDTPDQFQGFHSDHLLAIIDEGSGVPDIIYEAIDGCKPEKVLVLGNPMRNIGRFAQMFKDEAVAKIHISAFDIPNIKGGIFIQGLLEQTEIDRFKRIYGEDSDVYRVRVLGEFPRSDNKAFIPIDFVEMAFYRDISDQSYLDLKMGVDVAYEGNDLTAIVIRQGQKIIFYKTFAKQELMATVGQIVLLMNEFKIKPENIYIDVTGVGGGVCSRLLELGYNINKVNFGGNANNDEMFANTRIEIWDGMREWLKDGQLPKDDRWYQVCNIHLADPTSKGQMLLESKKKLKDKSPDLGDALALTFYKPKQHNVQIGFV